MASSSSVTTQPYDHGDVSSLRVEKQLVCSVHFHLYGYTSCSVPPEIENHFENIRLSFKGSHRCRRIKVHCGFLNNSRGISTTTTCLTMTDFSGEHQGRGLAHRGRRWSGIWRLVLLKNLGAGISSPSLDTNTTRAFTKRRRKRYARPLIDKHMEIYKREGMQPWSKAKLPVLSGKSAPILPTFLGAKFDISRCSRGSSDHPRAHSTHELVCCLWFNEVNRFTPRDQLSFGYVVHRLNGSFPLFMFPNCEYNALFVLHKHTREHSSKVEWVKTLDELKDESIAFETRAGLGLLGDR
ncbi:hypothetical protein SELMODRAFT_420228 [Selaginella moellendorffii]|uniref:TOD1/MUCI70 glycosyltransferase-like domain-containing protein n=1 Tax=Selaginella moellendorffii TaxID=88036 RepID=D8SBC2_SELML|nr:hypothetical protein SELMODRAFT_420228 [Selaginella moellendorffii]